ncbi:NAD(+) diphosphatase [Spirochaeta isovalerica]|uniref:NAD(+) diphosphatase n=1 Tax=Spirochaeta isovalerica TaxID=150 RepID=A0A841R7X5_9SPIO|nr:NAD(+) diphosphatase [Spirochaeta isovalerica]MBB6481384.1 NAD+ diphosphatase [Spirochaeta isovalerica]
MDNLSKSSFNYLTSSGLDRMPGVRENHDHFTSLTESPEARFLLIKGEENLLREDNAVSPVLLTFKDTGLKTINKEFCYLLGKKDNLVYFALDLDFHGQKINLPEGAAFTHLRKSRIDVKDWTGALIAYANALVSWHRNHRFCGKCGSATETAEMGQARYCSKGTCATPHYPRTDPAVIVVVTRDDKCLLARKAGWPEGMYSIVAGYVDHGESLEDAVVREVFEETGIHVRSTEYHSSQPWPFPYTLMLGYFAEADEGDIVVDHNELEDARWFSREDIIEGLQKGTHKLPSSFSISRKLITEWFNKGNKGSLSSYL